MKNIKKILSLVSILFFVQSTFAATGSVVNTGATSSTGSTSTSLEVPSAPRLVSKTATGVTLEWDKVAAAAAYIVNYGKVSVAKSTDPNEQYTDETDQITQTGTTITPLDPNTKYYFSIVAVDKEGNESNTFSSELGDVMTDALGVVSSTGATLTGATATGSLSLNTIDIIDNKTLSLTFSVPLSSDPVQVKITKTSNNADVPSTVTLDTAAPNKAIVKIESVLDISSSYSLSVIAAKDTAGNTIKDGVDGIKEFTTPATMALSPDLNSASGATSTGELAVKPTEIKSGPAENLIIVTALILSFGLVFFYRRKLIK
ncbi:MAG: fibronectin type III domain-containing protein [Candidatus Gracilibacteria bacterium]|nr:fibronectin type III domain-containing protein [Candidatus Gracilibacteria bacterium]